MTRSRERLLRAKDASSQGAGHSVCFGKGLRSIHIPSVMEYRG